jgi:TatD DNase family protein
MDIQIRIFRKQLSIAADLGLPSIIHCMGAWSELDSALKAVPVKRGGIIHNFNGSEELARSLSKLGISFSMGGTLTYRDSVKRERMLKSIYPDHFLLETDSPDIPPIEKRGLTNEPAYIRYSLSAASEILSVSEELIAESTSRNADNIFFS